VGLLALAWIGLKVTPVATVQDKRVAQRMIKGGDPLEVCILVAFTMK
jgi:hypothetical protein